MKLVQALVALVGGLILVLMVGSLMLSPDYAVSRSVLVNAPAAKIYPLIESSKGWASWGVWYRKDPQMQVTETGVEKGIGAAWRWKSESQGNGSMKLTAAVPDQKVGYELAIDDFDPSQGELSLAAEGQATRVTWTMQGHMSSRSGRWFALFMDKLVGPDFEAGLANLKQLAETEKKN